MTLGKRLRKARERLRPKLTQEKLGEELGVTAAAVSNWERDVDAPEHERLPALRRALKVTYAWLLEGNSSPPAHDDPTVQIEDATADERAAASAFLEAYRRQRGQAA